MNRRAINRRAANNRHNNVRLTFEGKTHTMAEWARIKNISYKALHWRLKNGWPLEKALTTKEKKKKQVNFDGQDMTIDKLEKVSGTHRSTIRYRLKNGFSVEEAVNGPPKEEKLYEYNGLKMTAEEWASRLEISVDGFYQRIRRHPEDKDKIFMPPPKYRAKDYPKEFHTFYSMTARCKNKCNMRYGGRGIKNDYKDATEFIDDVGTAPSPTAQIERIDNDGNYEPGNCRWAEAKEQANNRRSSRIVTYKGNKYTVAELSRLTGIPYSRLSYRINAGWTIDEATKP